MTKNPRICISAGHGKGSRRSGQTDPGADVVNTPATEDDVTLAMAQDLVADFRAIFQAAKRGDAMLRDAGRYYLADDDAVDWGATELLELHTDAAAPKAKPDGKTMGTTAIYESSNAVNLANALAIAVSSGMKVKNRGARRRTDLAVLTPHKGLRSILLELMFGSDGDDVAHYKANRRAVRLAILNTYLREWGWPPVRKVPSEEWTAASRLRYYLISR